MGASNCKPLGSPLLIVSKKQLQESIAKLERLSTRGSETQKKPYYITTPIFYPNSVPHIGHLYSLVVGDIFSRYNKLCDPSRPVHLVNGTDEHGWKIQKAAEQQGMEPLAFCDQLSVHFRDLIKKANVNVTRFTRTTEPEHCTAVHSLWRKLDEKGLIYKGFHDGWYSISDECFYTETQITKVKTPTGAVAASETEYMAIETSSRVEHLTEENYKFRLSQFRKPLLAYYRSNPDTVYPPQQYEDVLEMLSEPLNDLSVSRPRSRLHWGITVPTDPEHTIYVWIDALTTYMSSVGYPWPSSGGSGLEQGWPPNLQVIGKDILRFHAIYLPAMLMALDIPLPKRILSHAHWTVEHRKMSKSLGNVVDPIKAIDEYGIDVVRYYLARVGGRFKVDTSWDPEQLENVSKEISSLLGNLYLRISSKSIQARALKGGDGKALSPDNEGFTDRAHELVTKLHEIKKSTQAKMDVFAVADALLDITLVLREVGFISSLVCSCMIDILCSITVG
ncbi:hypothetical protein EUX98_g4305 [Antrodiella citrinella]|uniref:Probable methionine--tRNA ligase, mitochondrial n=1 Tax=Antrodiella citrinella TaxID=2447956 RepID=A0A4S4MWR9_9APHY|nr:hypothetical protein EUX98_g4305 [Antrodiella citrinella]